MLPVLFAITLFTSAALMFAVQPFAGKTLLPLAGGTPAVWTTCLLFFQAVLLLGYLYADRLGRLPPRRQVGWHLVVVALGLLAFALVRPDPTWVPDESEYPVFGLLAYLTALVGVPFFVLSTSAPLLQRWFALTGHRAAGDPYFLYAASNAGSLVGLLAYPFVVEPVTPLGAVENLLVRGYAVFFWLAFACGWVVAGCHSVLAFGGSVERPGRDGRPPRARILKWVALAALPSSLLMSVTAHVTTDVAPVPLLWVVPLAVYLLSFVVVFARWADRARVVVGRVTPMLLVFLCVALLTGATEPLAAVVAVHLAAFAAAALLCHGELAHGRPAREHLTTFYLAMSVGGVLGGLVNAVVAPVLFSRFGHVEYPLAVVAVALVRPRRGEGLEPPRLTAPDAAYLVAFASLAAGLVWQVPRFVEVPADPGSPESLVPRLVRAGLTFGVPGVVAFALVGRPGRFAASIAAFLLIGTFAPGPYGRTLLTTRNFFGTLRVAESPDGRFVRLVHGTTLHGQQWKGRPGPPEPLMYYHRKGPIGVLLDKLPTERRRRVAAVGLGCGALTAYARPGEAWTFYEIDPAVERIARDERFFTFLRETKGEVTVEIGDARHRLAREPDGSFDLIILDAFSSDAIPVHLLTREAFAAYVRKLARGGVLAFHLSNRYLDLPPLVARLGADHDPLFRTWVNEDLGVDTENGQFPSVWAALARDPADLGPVAKDLRWQARPPVPGPVWTDGFSNLLGVWKRDEE